MIRSVVSTICLNVRARLVFSLASVLYHNVSSLSLDANFVASKNGELELNVWEATVPEVLQKHVAARKTSALFFGDSILRFAVSDFCNQTRSQVWESIGDIRHYKQAGPFICNVTHSEILLLEFMQYGFGYDLQQTSEFTYGNPYSNSKMALEIISKHVAELGIAVDAVFLESNLWDIDRHDDGFQDIPWEDYTREWNDNATEMIHLVEELFPVSKHVWISTCVSPEDTRKERSESLNRAALAILPGRWTYIDTESILHHDLHYRDKWHLDAQSTIPLVKYLLEVVAEVDLSDVELGPYRSQQNNA